MNKKQKLFNTNYVLTNAIWQKKYVLSSWVPVSGFNTAHILYQYNVSIKSTSKISYKEGPKLQTLWILGAAL